MNKFNLLDGLTIVKFDNPSKLPNYASSLHKGQMKMYIKHSVNGGNHYITLSYDDSREVFEAGCKYVEIMEQKLTGQLYLIFNAEGGRGALRKSKGGNVAMVHSRNFVKKIQQYAMPEWKEEYRQILLSISANMSTDPRYVVYQIQKGATVLVNTTDL